MKKNKLWIPILAAVLVVALSAGILLLPRLPGDEVAVFPVTMVGYTDYYSGSSESSGMVTTDKVQSLYLSSTQTVTEILVYPGQKVNKGDVLFTYDTTLSDLAIERKDLANQQLEVNLKTAKAELTALNKMKPIVYKPSSSSSSSSTAKTDYSKSPSDKALLNTVYSTKTTGKSKSSPLYVWLQTSKDVDDAMIDYLFSQAGGSLSYVYVVFQMSSGNRPNTEFTVQTGIKFTKVYETTPTEPSQPGESTNPSETTPPSDSTGPSGTTPPTETTAPTEPPSESTEPPTEAPTDPPTDPPAENPGTESGEASGGESADEPMDEPAGETPTPAQEKVFAGYSMSFFTPPSAPDEDSGTVQWNDGYTQAELTAMKSEKRAEIKQIEFDIKMGKAELNIMKKEAEDGKVVANFSGTVSEILEPAVALETGEPLMKITGGGGYYVEGTVSELALGTLTKGQNVTVNSWDTGAVYTGTIVEIGSYPVEDQNYYGFTNVTYYPYKVFIDESADLMEGYYVSMTYQTEAQAAGTLYLQNAFIRRDGNRSYVYVRNADGLLEQRYVEAGVSTDGYMTPIYSGITEEDYLAFPYGNTVTDGAPTYEGTDQDLYGY